MALDTVAATVLPTVMRDEGFRAHLYLDANAKATIGFGTCLEGGLDAEEAMFLLEHRLHKAAVAARAEFPWFAKLDAVRQGVITQMVYQLGVAGVAQFRDMGRAIAVAVQTSDAEIRQLSFTAAANEMRDSKWARHDSPAREMTTGTLARG